MRANERANERADEYSTQALYAPISGHFYPECRTGGVAVVVVVAMAAVHSVMKLHEMDAFIS